MKNKTIQNYLLISSLFVISGCGNSSSSNNITSQDNSSEAIFIAPTSSSSSDTYKTNGFTSGSRNTYKVINDTILEDAEDGTTNGWIGYDNSPSNVHISNIYDTSKESNVINLQGVGLKNGATFSLENGSEGRTIKWSMNYNEAFIIYIRLHTKNGLRYIYYTAANYNYGKAKAPYSYYIHHGLGSDSNKGTWQTFSRDLTQDLQEFEPNNTIDSVDGLYIRGSGRIDDISMLNTQIPEPCIGYHALKQQINNNQDVTQADTSCITDMSGLFSDNHDFNQDISAWNTSNVTNMAYMFKQAKEFNQDIGSWDVSKVTNMRSMFNHASHFNKDINSWDVSSVTNMDNMFLYANDFNQNLYAWNVSHVTTMHSMFHCAFNFNQNINSWNVSNVTDMYYMFYCTRQFNQPLNSWDVSSVKTMEYMFGPLFNQDISSWDVSNVTNMKAMFSYNRTFNQDISSWDVSNVTNMYQMFTNTKAFNQDLSSWNVKSVTDHRGFAKDSKQNIIEPNWEGSNSSSQIQEALASQINYHTPIKAEDITDLPDGNKLVTIQTGFAHIDTSNLNDFKVTRFDSAFSDVSSAYSESILSKDKHKLYILSEDEEIFVRLQIINLVTLTTEQNLEIEDILINLGSKHTTLHLSDNEQQLIIPKEYVHAVDPKDIAIDLATGKVVNR